MPVKVLLNFDKHALPFPHCVNDNSAKSEHYSLSDLPTSPSHDGNIEMLQKQVQELKTASATAKRNDDEEIQKLRKQVQEAQAAFAKAKTDHEEQIKAQQKSMQESREALLKKQHALHAEVARLNIEVSSETLKLTQYKKQSTTLIKTLQEQLQAEKDQCQLLQSQLLSMSKQQASSDKVSDLAQQIANLQQQLAETSQTMRALETENKQFLNNLKEKEAKIQEQTAQIIELKDQLSDSSDDEDKSTGKANSDSSSESELNTGGDEGEKDGIEADATQEPEDKILETVVDKVLSKEDISRQFPIFSAVYNSQKESSLKQLKDLMEVYTSDNDTQREAIDNAQKQEIFSAWKKKLKEAYDEQKDEYDAVLIPYLSKLEKSKQLKITLQTFLNDVFQNSEQAQEDGAEGEIEHEAEKENEAGAALSLEEEDVILWACGPKYTQTIGHKMFSARDKLRFEAALQRYTDPKKRKFFERISAILKKKEHKGLTLIQKATDVIRETAESLKKKNKITKTIKTPKQWKGNNVLLDLILETNFGVQAQVSFASHSFDNLYV